MDRTTRKRTLDPPPGAKLSDGWSVVKGSADPHHKHLAPDGGRRFSSRKTAVEARRAGGSAPTISSSTTTTPPPPLRQLQPTHSRTMSPPSAAAAASTLSLPRASDASEMTAEETHAFKRALQQQQEQAVADRESHGFDLPPLQANCEPFMGGTADGATAKPRSSGHAKQPRPQPSFKQGTDARSSFKQEEDVRSALHVAGYQEFHSLGSDQMPPQGFFKWVHAKWDTRLASLLTDGKSNRIDFVVGVPNGFVFLEVDGRRARRAKDETARKRQPASAWPAGRG